MQEASRRRLRFGNDDAVDGVDGAIDNATANRVLRDSEESLFDDGLAEGPAGIRVLESVDLRSNVSVHRTPTKKTSYDDNGHSYLEKPAAPKRLRHDPKAGRRNVDRSLEESSSFRCLAHCQKYRMFSMYFILSHLAGYSCVAFMGVNIFVQLFMIIIGFVFMGECPMQGNLTTWNICTGIAFSLKMFTAMMFLAVMRKDIRLTGGVPEKTTIYKSPRYFCLLGVVDCLLFTLLVLGMTLTVPHLPCMTLRVAKHPTPRCSSNASCNELAYFFSFSAMVFLEVVYFLGYVIGLWISGCFYTVSAGEEAAGKVVKGYSKIRNRSTWNIKMEERKSQNRKENTKKDIKFKRKKKRGLMKAARKR